jgi:hypothetical protein
MWPLYRALSSFLITTVCHLHLQGSNFLCGWLMPWLLTSLKGKPFLMLAFISQMMFFHMANFTLPFHAPRHQWMSKFNCQTVCMAKLALCVMLCKKKPSFETTCLSYVHDMQLFKTECFFVINMV